jgi:hypothetical protein
VAKLGDATRANLKEDAGSMEDEAWEKRLSEVEELSDTKRDAKLDPKSKGGAGGKEPSKTTEGGSGGESSSKEHEEEEFDIEELAESIAGGGSDGSGDGGGMPSSHQRRSLARGLVGSGSKSKDE